MPTTGRFCERSTGSSCSTDGEWRGNKAALPYVRSARTTGDDLDLGAQNLAYRTSAETQALVKTNRSAYIRREIFSSP